MRIITPIDADQRPLPGRPMVFLAGSIDEGRAERWQDEAITALAHLDVTVLNPRRSAWNADLRQDIDEPEFVAQVEWELDGIERADVVLFHFSPQGPAPISLLELGKATALGKRIIISCPEGYWRRGNVQVVARRADATFHDRLEDAITDLIGVLGTIHHAQETVPIPITTDEAVLMLEMIRSEPTTSERSRSYRIELQSLREKATRLLAQDLRVRERRRKGDRPDIVTPEIDAALRRALDASTTYVADPIILDGNASTPVLQNGLRDTCDDQTEDEKGA